eukprot:CAMPEP_0175092644 /NCGR_PEP_ID=MMETSP0086_2-20121207/2573_1 /TAXON_ID=136419 /ORGANISM="Unknown Unknown, Strain D1" /LENGTH=197 /DNA_ID=CAMNT_0016365521 /DNA_START=119 /DNA_END=712 /DNA_ORIENTATION=+
MALTLSCISLVFPFVAWSNLQTDTRDGSFCFKQSIGLLSAEQCSCDLTDLKCFDVDLNALPAGYDFYKLGGKVVLALILVSIGSLLGSIAVVFMRGGANANNVRAPGYRNLKLFSSVSCLYTATLYLVAASLWSSYINNELNYGFSKQVKGVYSLGSGFYLNVASCFFVFGSAFVQMWTPESSPDGYAPMKSKKSVS